MMIILYKYKQKATQETVYIAVTVVGLSVILVVIACCLKWIATGVCSY